MPNIKSAKKRMNLSAAARTANRSERSRIRTAIKQVRSAETVDAVARNFEPLREIFGTVAFENNVAYFAVGDPLDEPRLFGDVCDLTGCGMVLDLHNAYTTCLNFDLDLHAWLADIPLRSVIEIHVSGGSPVDPEWFESTRSIRLVRPGP